MSRLVYAPRALDRVMCIGVDSIFTGKTVQGF